jgi:hypothetical protein
VLTADASRGAALAALSRVRASFIVGVALIPSLLTWVFQGIGSWLPWWAWSLLLGSVAALLFWLALRGELEWERRRGAVVDGVRQVQALDAITDLVLTVDLTNRDRPQNLHTLMRVLPNVQRVHAVVGQPADPAEDLTGDLRRLLDRTARPEVHGQVLMAVPVLDVEDPPLQSLRERLTRLDAARAEGTVLAVDITGGTVPMSLVTYMAARSAGLPVTYTATHSPSGSRNPADREYKAMVALQDPAGVLTGSPQGGSQP